MDKILIIGYGNSLAGDDALGFYTVQELVGSEMPENVTVKYIHQLMPEHASDISEHDTVIFIDAEESDVPGEIKCRKIVKNDLHDTSSAAHEYTLDSILLLSGELYGKMPEVYLVTVTGKYFLTGGSMSKEVEQRIPDVIDTVFRIVNRKNNDSSIPAVI